MQPRDRRIALFKLHRFNGSSTCRPVEMFGAEAGIALELVDADLMTGEHISAAYAATNPLQQVPTLEDGDFRLAENAAVLRELAELVGSPASPKELKARPGWRAGNAGWEAWRDHVLGSAA